MNTRVNKHAQDEQDEFDYQAHLRETAPDPVAIQRGTHARQKRREGAKERITIRIDEHIVEQFRHLAGKQGYQRLMNQALGEWLVAQGVKELVRTELQALAGDIRSAVHSAQT